MSRVEREAVTASARTHSGGTERNSADTMLAPLRSVRKLHAMTAPPSARGRQTELPLTTAQTRIWIFSRLNPDLPIFNTFRAYRVSGPLDLDLLERCLNKVSARHEVLRTTYPEIDGLPRPVIAETANIRLWIDQQTGLFASGEEDRLLEYCNGRISRPIDLIHGPIFRAEVARVAEDEYLLILVSHQMIFDGASWSVMNRELTALYESGCSGSTPGLNQLPLQFIDFAFWQDRYLRSGALDQLTSYWQQQIGNSQPSLDLPARDNSQTPAYHDGRSLPFKISAKLTEDLKALGKNEGVTLFVVLLSAFNLLLHKFAGQGSPVVFTSVPCRTRAEFRNLIGLFSNFIPLRMDFSANPRFCDALADLQKRYVGALGHQDLPFEYITREFQGGQGADDETLFQTLFVFENAAKKPLSLSRCSLTPLSLKTGFTKFDLTLFLEEIEDGMSGSLRYKPNRYKPAMIEMMVDRFVKVLQAVAAQPERRVGDIRCLTPSELDELRTARVSSVRNEITRIARSEATSAGQSAVTRVMPRTRMESRVAAVWQEVLGIDSIGIRDNFFDLGGNSLLLITLAGRLQENLGHKVSILEIFRDPTIHSFVERLGDQTDEAAAYDHVHERTAKRRAAMNRRKGRGRKG